MPAPNQPAFVVATPGRSVCDDNARALDRHGLLRFIALGTRRGTAGIPPERTRLNPAIGLAAYAAARALSPYRAEAFRIRLLPWFNRWVREQLRPGDHLISSFGYVTDSFKYARAHGGKTFLDGGNTHIQNFWDVISEEHRRWNVHQPPFSPRWLRRSLESIEHTDYILSPSTHVTQSFLARGFRPDQIVRNIYPVDLSCFRPPDRPRPADRPFTIINTASLSLRKGTPYLLEACSKIREKLPSVRILLTQIVQDDVKEILARHRNLPIQWSPGLPHPQLAERLRSADLFILPSLEEGLARTALEAMACGLPAIVTANTGANDFVQPGLNGEIVSLRDPQAIADAALKWADIVTRPDWQPRPLLDPQTFSFDHFEREFLAQLREKGVVGG